MNFELDEKTMEHMNGLLSEFKDEYFKSMLNPIKHIYIDLEVLQDFRLGALFCLISTDSEYQYIKHVLEQEQCPYQVRLDDLTMSYFPAIKSITDDDITEFINDSANHKALVKVSPMTYMYTQFREIMQVIVDRNQSIDKSKDPGAKFHIGTNTVKYDNEDIFNLMVAFFSGDTRFPIVVYNKPLHAIGRDFKEYQMYFIYNISDFLQHPNHAVMFDVDIPILDSTIFGYPLLELQADTNEKKSELLANTELFFNTYTNFHYIPRGVGL